MNNEWKIEVDLEEIYPGSTISQSKPGLVILLNRGKTITKINKLDSGKAILDFEVIWPWMIGWKSEFEDAVRKMLEKGSFRLTLNSTPDEAIDLLDELIDRT